jgi:hypothetical protein
VRILSGFSMAQFAWVSCAECVPRPQRRCSRNIFARRERDGLVIRKDSVVDCCMSSVFSVSDVLGFAVLHLITTLTK